MLTACLHPFAATQNASPPAIDLPSEPTVQLSECTAAGVAPPDSWATGFHALSLGPSTLGILQLIRGLVQRRPRLLSPQLVGAGVLACPLN